MNSDFSLIDSNLRRVSEGFRVLDELARFVFQSDSLFIRCKTMRHNWRPVEEHFGTTKLLHARVGKDVGVSAYISEENSRSSSWSIIRANSCRVSEALRVLEEFSKIYASEATSQIKAIRYEVYKLEIELLKHTPHFHLRHYFEQGIVYPLSESSEEILWLVDHGARVVQLRNKSNDKNRIYLQARQLCQEIAIRNKNKPDPTLFILNDHPDIAARLPVAGVHIGQEDGDIASVRRLVGSNKIIGRSNHSLEQIKKSVAAGADYVSIGPVFTTPTKPGRSAVGLEIIAEVAKVTSIPWLAIGGVDKNSIQAIYQAGAKNVAVVRSAKEFFV